MRVTAGDIASHRLAGSWRQLMSFASSMVKDSEAHAGSPMRPLLGGGTRLMLALNHRISDDIDLFIRDPQWLGYLTPRLNDRIEACVEAYEEGATSLKLKLSYGEIDFIVSMSLLGLPDEHEPGVLFALEPVAEVLAKKLFYRGFALTPRDLYDWWAIETMAPETLPQEKLAQLLKTKLDVIDAALSGLSSSTGAAPLREHQSGSSGGHARH